MTTSKLMMRAEAHVETVDDGLLVYTHQGSTLVKGTGIAPWVEVIRPLLDGTRDHTQVLEAVPATHAASIARLVDRLLGLGVVREIDPADQPVTDRAEERFVSYFRTGGAAAYARFRATPAVVLGRAPLVQVLADGCRDAGIRDVSLARPADLPRDGGPGAVLHVLDSVDDDSAGPVARWCAARDVPLLQVLRHAARTWMSLPRPTSGGDLPGLFPVLRRLAMDSEPAAPSAKHPPTPGAEIACLRGVHELMRWSCGITEAAGSPRVVTVDDESLVSRSHRVVPHPWDRAVPLGAGAGAAELAVQAAVTIEEFALRAGAVMDAETGVFAEVNEGSLSQLPLNRSSTVVRVPDGSAAGFEEVTVHGVGEGFEAARHAVALEALAVYAVRMVDPRRLQTPDQQVWQRPAESCEAAMVRLGEGTSPAYVQGVDLVSGATVDVPAAQVFGHADGPDRPPGVAARLTWADAVEAALAEHLRPALLRECGSGEVTLTPLVIDRRVDDRLRYPLAMLEALGEHPTAVRVRGRSGVEGVGLLVGGALVALTWRSSCHEALLDALISRLMTYQDLPGHLTVPAGLIAATVLGEPEGQPVAPRDRPDQLPQETAAMLGGSWVAVPLDHDPSVTAVTPYLVRVVEVSDD